MCLVCGKEIDAREEICKECKEMIAEIARQRWARKHRRLLEKNGEKKS